MSPRIGIGHGSPPWAVAGGGNGSGADPEVVEDFSEYTNTQELLDSDKYQGGGTDEGSEEIHLDTSTGVDESPWGTSDRSMRYDYIDQGCDTIFRGRNLTHPNASEAWFEIVMKFSSNYTPCNSDCDPCDHKLILHQTSEAGRFMWHPNANGASAPYNNQSPQWGFCCSGGVTDGWFTVTGDTVKSDAWMDAEWHRFRIHIRSSTDEQTEDGLYEWWFDDQGPWSRNGATPDDTLLQLLDMGSNKDKGLDSGTESVWWGQVKIWTEAPSWDIGT